MPAPALPSDDELYRSLQQHLDRLPVPFPATGSGVELSILRRLFSQDDARLALCLSAIPETIATIYRRAGKAMAREALAAALDGMSERGLIQRVPTRRGVMYGTSPFVVGFYEAQVDRLTAGLQRDVDRYADEGFGAAFHSGRSPQLRTVPVNESIPFERAVGRYDDIRALVQASPGPFAVMNCICQQGKDLVGEPCRQTADREHCLTIGMAAESMVARGPARFISRDETLEFLARADGEGLVVQPQNTQDPLFICCCCGCCCGVLTTAKTLPNPATFFATNFHAEVDADLCNSCLVCEARCQMEAIACDAGPAAVKVERCIGCGLCVTTCETGAVRLAANPGARVPPKDTGRLYARMYRERFGTLALAAAAGRRLIGAKL